MIITYSSKQLNKVLQHLDNAALQQTITRNNGLWSITLTYSNEELI